MSWRDFFQDLMRRFTSRKLLVALAVVVTALQQGQTWAAAAAAGVYALAQSFADVQEIRSAAVPESELPL